MKTSVFALTIFGFFVVCKTCAPVQTMTTHSGVSATTPSTTTTIPPGGLRKKREIEAMEIDEDFAIISALTFYPFGTDEQNQEYADKVEEQ
uniref:Secreted protein n=1 Tax=Panagrolaimus sp. JU765 TaxID=591449 RepID=A0AC34QB77_9BILA